MPPYSNPPAFPTLPGANAADVKVNVSPTQEVISLDLNNLSNYLHQIIKDFNLNVFANSYGTSTGATQGGCVVNGMAVTGANASSITVDPGLFIFSAFPDTGTTAYSGTLVKFNGTVLSVAFPGANSWIVGIDIPYTEIADTTLTYRNFYNVTGDTVQSQATAVTTVPTIGTILTPNGSAAISPIAPAISAGCIRIANITINSIGNVTNISYTLPFIWNAQGWPGGTPGDVTKILTLDDSLAAIRYQLNQIISVTPTDALGAITTQNWNNTVPISLNQLITWGGVDTGLPNAYKLTIPYFPSTIVAGMKVCFHALNANTSFCTLQINGGTLYTIKDSVGNDLAPSTINGSQFLLLVFDGTNWVIPNILSVAPVTQLQVPNGSFENWAGTTLSTWSIPSISTGVTITRDTAGSIDGGSALSIFSGNFGGVGGNTTLVSGLITISPQDAYFIKWKTKCPLTNYTTAVAATFYDANKTPIVSSTLPLFVNGPSTNYLNVNWKTYYGTVADSTFISGDVISGTTTGLIAVMPPTARFMAIVIAAGASSPGLAPEQNITIEFDGFEFFYPGKSGITLSFTTAGTFNFTTPGNCTVLDSTLIAGGGGGGGSQFAANSNSFSGGGGGQGGVIKGPIFVTPDTVYTVDVGAGGNGAAGIAGPGTAGNGSPGSQTKLRLGSTNILVVNGGSGGTGNSNTSTPAGGSGGTLSSYSFPTILLQNKTTGGSGSNGGGPKGFGPEPNGGQGGGVDIQSPYLHNLGGLRHSQDGGGPGNDTAPSGPGAGGSGGALGAVGNSGQNGNTGAAYIQF